MTCISSLYVVIVGGSLDGIFPPQTGQKGGAPMWYNALHSNLVVVSSSIVTTIFVVIILSIVATNIDVAVTIVVTTITTSVISSRIATVISIVTNVILIRMPWLTLYYG